MTSSDLIAPIGTTYQCCALDYTWVIPWETLSGPGVVWSYGSLSLEVGGSFTSMISDPSNIPGYALFPDADLFQAGGFHDLTTNALHRLGYVSFWNDTVFYTEPELIYAFPMDLGDTVHGNYSYWVNWGGILDTVAGETYVTFDATGTLVLPYGTYANVRHITKWKSGIESLTAPDSTYFINQLWFAAGIPYPLLNITRYIDTDGFPYLSGSLAYPPSTASVEEVSSLSNWFIFPNPVEDEVVLEGLPNEDIRVEVLTMDGRLIKALNSSGSVRIMLDLKGIASGIYSVRVSGHGMTGSQRLIKR